MKLIPLTRGKFAIVSDEDHEEMAAYKWRAAPASRPVGCWYAVRSGRDGEPKTVYMHRQIARAKRGDQVDHINRDALDNRRGNLRLCDQTLNNANMRAAPSSTGFRGVFAQNGRYRANVSYRGKTHYAGTHDTPEAAARARDALAAKFFGGFAVLNFPEEAA